MKTELIYLYEIANYPELADYLELTDEEDLLILFQGDPDMIRYQGYTEYFFRVVINDVKYIISNTEHSDVWDILKSFFSDNFEKTFSCPDPNNWDSFYTVDNAIAFRDDRGYVYTIYHF